MEEVKSLGQIAFEAYCEHKSNLDYQGKQIPPWGQVADGVREAWEAGVAAAIAENDSDMWRRICQMRAVLIAMKSENRTEQDRRIAVAVTKFEYFLSWYNTMILEGFTGEIHAR